MHHLGYLAQLVQRQSNNNYYSGIEGEKDWGKRNISLGTYGKIGNDVTYVIRISGEEWS